MEAGEIVGWLATAASTASFTPQSWKIVRTRETHDLSTGMYVLTVSGFALRSAYGFILGAWPLVATNVICLSLSAFILTMKLPPRRDRERIADALDPRQERKGRNRPGGSGTSRAGSPGPIRC